MLGAMMWAALYWLSVAGVGNGRFLRKSLTPNGAEGSFMKKSVPRLEYLQEEINFAEKGIAYSSKSEKRSEKVFKIEKKEGGEM